MERKPFLVLGQYKPSKRRASIVGPALVSFTRDANLKPFQDDIIKRNTGAAWFDYDNHAEVRITAVPGSEGEDWHRDGDTSSGCDMHCALVLWVNKAPTEIKYNDKIYTAEPFDVILFKNMSVLHRRPPNAPMKRFSFRQRVEVPSFFPLV